MITYSGVTSEEMDHFRAGILAQYPAAPDLRAEQVGPIPIEYDCELFWTLAGSALMVTIRGASVSLQTVARRVKLLVKACTGHVPG